MLHEPIPARVRPDRLTFAHVCIWCGTRDCAAPDCIDLHQRALWMDCPDCDGALQLPDSLQPCGCLYGLIQATPAAVDGAR